MARTALLRWWTNGAFGGGADVPKLEAITVRVVIPRDKPMEYLLSAADAPGVFLSTEGLSLVVDHHRDAPSQPRKSAAPDPGSVGRYRRAAPRRRQPASAQLVLMRAGRWTPARWCDA